MEPFLLRTILRVDHGIKIKAVQIPVNKINPKNIWEPIEELTDFDLFLMEKCFKRKKHFNTKLEAIKQIIAQGTQSSVSMHLQNHNLTIVIVKK